MICNFEELIVWQLARELVTKVYSLLQDNKDFGFRDQIQRAAISVMNNIAEGFERSKYAKDNAMFIHFLGIAMGSSTEVKSMLYTAEDLAYIHPEECILLRNQCTDIAIKISSLIKFLMEHPKNTK